MKILIAAIKGRALRWAVAQAMNMELHNINDLKWEDDQYWTFWGDGTIRHAVEIQNNNSMNRRYWYDYFKPDENPEQAAKIIDEFHISTVWDGSCWIGSMYNHDEQCWYGTQTSQNRLEAAMRTFLWHKYGTEVEVPDNVQNE